MAQQKQILAGVLLGILASSTHNLHTMGNPKKDRKSDRFYPAIEQFLHNAAIVCHNISNHEQRISNRTSTHEERVSEMESIVPIKRHFNHAIRAMAPGQLSTKDFVRMTMLDIADMAVLRRETLLIQQLKEARLYGKEAKKYATIASKMRISGSEDVKIIREADLATEHHLEPFDRALKAVEMVVQNAEHANQLMAKLAEYCS